MAEVPASPIPPQQFPFEAKDRRFAGPILAGQHAVADKLPDSGAHGAVVLGRCRSHQRGVARIGADQQRSQRSLILRRISFVVAGKSASMIASSCCAKVASSRARLSVSVLRIAILMSRNLFVCGRRRSGKHGTPTEVAEAKNPGVAMPGFRANAPGPRGTLVTKIVAKTLPADWHAFQLRHRWSEPVSPSPGFRLSLATH